MPGMQMRAMTKKNVCTEVPVKMPHALEKATKSGV
jgi:hypothetical protein